MGWMSAEAFFAKQDRRNEREEERLAKLASLMETPPGGARRTSHESDLAGFIMTDGGLKQKKGADYAARLGGEGKEEFRSMRAAERLRLPSKVYRHAPATLPDDIILKAERLGVDLAKYAAEA